MASTEPIQQRKRELSARLAACRGGTGPRGTGLLGQLSPFRRLQRTFAGHPLRVFGLTLAGTAFLTLLLRARRRSKSRRSSIGFLTVWLLGLFQPAIRHWLLVKAKEHIVHTGERDAPESLPRP